ncbi:lipid metabolism-like protein [Caballeronia sordidicola]|uniref:Lipid metabolism-like protein n=1 Tax=Caballeronia sordidicola TaxID=196367 RepID=A0A158HVZ8_CABSO|nr:CoA transferase [Caballeronia sordidicola]SAL48565.1 lipid metabolism-like protein [Caballeronia sordidicola]
MRREALSGIRVIDFSWVLAGPMTTKMLAAMGAEVIKIESATRPEHVHRPPWWAVVNAGKLSCTINLSRPEGTALVRRLVASSDMVVENFSNGVLAKFGLDYDTLRAIREDLVFVSASGTGREGPQRNALAYGSLLQAYSGRASVVGTPNTRVEAMGILPAWTDPITALWESAAVLAAVRHRRRTGEGAHIDLSMLESTVALLPELLFREALHSDEPASNGACESSAAPSGCFRCKGADAWLALSVRNDTEWRALCDAMEQPGLAADARFSEHVNRAAHRAETDATVAAWAREQDVSQALEMLQSRGIPAARSRHIGEVIEDPHFVERGLFPTLSDGSRSIALPWQDAAGWRGKLSPPPRLGEHNDYVFRTLLGLSSDEINTLSEAGVLR